MLVTNENVRLYFHDKILGATLVRLIPGFVHPNHVTMLRFVLIPIVTWLIWSGSWNWALSLFLFAAFTDALDGTLARLRKQITMWGTVADPVADKLLIGFAAVILVARELSPLLAAVIVSMELLIVVGATYRGRLGIHTSANGWGKAKMLLQVIGLACLLLASLYGGTALLYIGAAALILALPVGFISFLTYSL